MTLDQTQVEVKDTASRGISVSVSVRSNPYMLAQSHTSSKVNFLMVSMAKQNLEKKKKRKSK